MKFKQISLRLVASVFLFGVAAFVISCKKDSDPISGDVLQSASNEAAVEAQTSETDDMAGNALLQADAPADRLVSLSDDRFACARLKFDSLSNKVEGTVTVDFDTTANGEYNPNGCTDGRGNTRKGQIIIHWTGGRWYLTGATYTIHFHNYSINDVSFSNDDVRTVTNVSTTQSPLTWTLVASHTLTWPDNTTATRSVHETRQWIRSANFVDDQFNISQTIGADNAASGSTRYGKTYNTQITNTIVYSRSCAVSNKVFLPVAGTKVITIDNNRTWTVDFGTGTCDNTFTITIAGHSLTINAKNDSSGD